MTQLNDDAKVNEAEIASHWKEEERIYPDTGFISQANMADPSAVSYTHLTLPTTPYV